MDKLVGCISSFFLQEVRAPNDPCTHETQLGTGQNLLGTRAGTIDRRGDNFFSKKNRGRRLFFGQN